MGKFSVSISNDHREFIEKQHLFFVATAPLSIDGHVNLSPKGMDSFRVLTPNRVAYMDVVSSGNETSAHILENRRITFMFCSFESPPNIMRLYGKAYAVLPEDREWEEMSNHFSIPVSVRQILVADIDKVQTSCGYGVPLYTYMGERDNHQKWAEKIGIEGIEEYKLKNNLTSIDGRPTAIAKQGTVL